MQDQPDASGTHCLRIAAAGDVHCSEARRDGIRRSIAGLNGVADVVLLAGDLTTHGEPEQGAVLADACAALDVPVFAVPVIARDFWLFELDVPRPAHVGGWGPIH